MPDHTVPYGTILSVDAVPGTSCQATIMRSLWDQMHSLHRSLIRLAFVGFTLKRLPNMLQGLTVNNQKRDSTTLKLLANVQTAE